MDYYFGATSVPEFGVVTGVVAAIGSGLAYWGMKRKFAYPTYPMFWENTARIKSENAPWNIKKRLTRKRL